MVLHQMLHWQDDGLVAFFHHLFEITAVIHEILKLLGKFIIVKYIVYKEETGGLCVCY